MVIEIHREASRDGSVDQGGGEEDSYDHGRIDVDNEEEDEDEDPDEDDEDEHRSDGMADILLANINLLTSGKVS